MNCPFYFKGDKVGNLIIRDKNQLPVTIEKLNQFILIGKAKLKSHLAIIHAINKVEASKEAIQAATEDAQDTAIMVLQASAKLGELLKAIPKKRDKGSSTKVTSLSNC